MYDLIIFQLNDTLCYPLSPYNKIRTETINNNIGSDKNFECQYSFHDEAIVNLNNCLSCSRIMEDMPCVFDQQICVNWSKEHVLYRGVKEFLEYVRARYNAEVSLLVRGSENFSNAITQQLDLTKHFDHVIHYNIVYEQITKAYFSDLARKNGLVNSRCLFVGGGSDNLCRTARLAGWEALHVKPRNSNSYLYGIDLLEASDEYKRNLKHHNVCWSG